MNIVVTTEKVWSMADEIVGYLTGPRLWIPQSDYPDFEDWAQRVHAQLKSEAKRAVVALSAGAVVGAAVYQPHRSDPRVLEVKNITVRPDARGRLLATFMLRNAEVEGAADFGCREAAVDAKARNSALRAFLFKSGYRVDRVEDLYGLGAGADVVYRKTLPMAAASRSTITG